MSWPNVASPLGIAPGASVRVPVTFRTLVAGPNIPNVATVTGAVDTFGDPATNAADTNSTLGVYDAGRFVISKTADPAGGTIVLPGDTITYTLSWNNTQQVTVPDVRHHRPAPGIGRLHRRLDEARHDEPDRCR